MNTPSQIICKPFQSCALNLAADGIHAIGCKGTEFSLPKPHKNPFEDVDELYIQDATPAIIQVDKDLDLKDIDVIRKILPIHL